MTVQKGEIELQRALMVKTLRTAIRLKHSLAADAELNERLPAAEQAFDERVQRGQLPSEGDVEEIVRGVSGDDQ